MPCKIRKKIKTVSDAVKLHPTIATLISSKEAMSNRFRSKRSLIIPVKGRIPKEAMDSTPTTVPAAAVVNPTLVA